MSNSHSDEFEYRTKRERSFGYASLLGSVK